MIVVFEFIKKFLNPPFLEGNISIVNIQPDNFTEIRFTKEQMLINSRTSLDSYLEYYYEDWAIKYIIDLCDKDDNMSNFDHYIHKELLKRFKVLDQPKEKTVNESLGILGK